LRRSKSFWGLSDQAVLSLGTFATNIAIMRAYKQDEETFGVYAMLMSTIFLLNNLHQSLVTYPLSVRGALMPDDGLRRLTTTSLMLTVAWSLPLQLILLIASGCLHAWWVYPFAGLALLGWQCQETTRRALMSHLRHNDAIWGDALSYLGQAAIVMSLCRHHVPSLPAIFLTIAGTSFAAATLQALQLRITRSSSWRQARDFGLEGWRIGSWHLMSNGLTFLSIQAVGWVILWAYAGDAGKRLVATFTALSTIMGVSHPVMFGICGLIVPGVAKARKELGELAARRYATKLTALGFGLLSVYFLFLTILPSLAIRIFCGVNSPYQQYAYLLPWFVLHYVVVYLSFTTGAYLNGLEASRHAFYGQLANAIASVLIRLPLAAMWGVGPAIWSGIITYGANMIVNFWGLRRVSTEEPIHDVPIPVVALEA
jgi:O-antigen/teichoic acid export membrane protein